MRYASRSDSLLRLKASRVRVFQFDLKTSGDITWMVHVALSWRLHRGQVEHERSIRRTASDPATFALLFSLYYDL
jgi:hypothetical protein